jgi:hypothetical protein
MCFWIATILILWMRDVCCCSILSLTRSLSEDWCHREILSTTSMKNAFVLNLFFKEEQMITVKLWRRTDRTISIVKMSNNNSFKSFKVVLEHRSYTNSLEKNAVSVVGIEYLSNIPTSTAVFFYLLWFAAPFRSLKKFGSTPNWLKMTILRHLM